MRRVAKTRRGHPDLLTRRPWLDHSITATATPGVNRADQLRALVELFDRGHLSREELSRQRGKVFLS
jgi:hypothetical protein